METHDTAIRRRPARPRLLRHGLIGGSSRTRWIPPRTDHAGLTWDAPIERVARGQGAFAIMGDWADGVSREGQDAFNSRKGSIPPRTDADPARYSPYSQSAIRGFRSAERFYPGFGTAVPDAYQAELKEIVADFLRTGDVDATDARLEQAAVRHQAAYARTWSLR